MWRSGGKCERKWLSWSAKWPIQSLYESNLILFYPWLFVASTSQWPQKWKRMTSEEAVSWRVLISASEMTSVNSGWRQSCNISWRKLVSQWRKLHMALKKWLDENGNHVNAIAEAIRSRGWLCHSMTTYVCRLIWLISGVCICGVIRSQSGVKADDCIRRQCLTKLLVSVTISNPERLFSRRLAYNERNALAENVSQW